MRFSSVFFGSVNDTEASVFGFYPLRSTTAMLLPHDFESRISLPKYIGPKFFLDFFAGIDECNNEQKKVLMFRFKSCPRKGFPRFFDDLS